MANYLITGTTRGIGLEIVRQLTAHPTSKIVHVFATYRTAPSTALNELAAANGRVKLIRMDVVDVESVDEALKEVQRVVPNDQGLDVLINNAGVMPWTPNGIASMTDLEDVFRSNVFSVHAVTAAFLPLLERGKSKTVVNLSTTLGSLAMAPRFALFPVPAYKVSKTALNMLNMQYALEYKDKGFSFITISPGWVQTDLGSEKADLTAAESVGSILNITDRAVADKSTNGKFFNVHVAGWEENPGLNQYDGKEPPW